VPVTQYYFEIVVFAEISVGMLELPKNVDKLIVILSFFFEVLVINESLLPQSSWPDLVSRYFG
jgi:hypothetical protein